MLTYADNPDLPVTYEDARAAGTLADYDWGDRCDPTRSYNDTGTTLARLAIPSVYAPPCVPVWGGNRPWRAAGGGTFTDNGGATAPGVSAETVKVVFYLAAEQDIAKQLEQFGVIDGQDAAIDGVRGLVEMSNHLYETYGRRVEVVPFHATGDGRSPSAARADAVRVVEHFSFDRPDTIRYEATIEDPKVFTRPWKISMPLYRRQEKNVQLLEYECYAYEREERLAATGTK